MNKIKPLEKELLKLYDSIRKEKLKELPAGNTKDLYFMYGYKTSKTDSMEIEFSKSTAYRRSDNGIESVNYRLIIYHNKCVILDEAVTKNPVGSLSHFINFVNNCMFLEPVKVENYCLIGIMNKIFNNITKC